MAGLVAPATLEQIRAASDVVDVIGSYLPLKRAGANFVALCPFHREKSPSFNVNPHRQIFHCFGCHKGGDVFTFVKEYENISFPDAVRRLAERAHIPLEFDNQPGQQQARHLKDTLWQIHEQITQRWQNALASEAGGQLARDYLRQRGVSPDAVKLFRLGCAPEAWDDTVNWATSKGHPLALVEQAGLILRKESSDRYYDRFRGRLIFPICDEQGRVIAFSGRVLAGDEKTAKYVNSPETPIFTKSKVFFGLDKSKRAILDAGFAIICEGQLDLIACFMAGVRNVAAPQGTAFTADHARLLKRYVEEVVLCFDSDNAGQSAASRSLDVVLQSGLAIRVMVIPSPHDPDSFIKEFGADAFKHLIDQSQDFFDFSLGRLCKINNIDSDKGRMAVVREMGELLRKTNSEILIDRNAQKTSARLQISLETIRKEFRKVSGTKMDWREAEEAENVNRMQTAPPSQEFWLLKLLLTNEEAAGWISAHLDVNWLQDLVIRKIVAAVLEAHKDTSWQGVAAFLSTQEDQTSRTLITQAASDRHAVMDANKILKGDGTKKGVLEILRNDFIDRQLSALTLRLAQPGLTDHQLHEIEREKTRLRQQRQQPIPGKSPMSTDQ